MFSFLLKCGWLIVDMRCQWVDYIQRLIYVWLFMTKKRDQRRLWATRGQIHQIVTFSMAFCRKGFSQFLSDLLICRTKHWAWSLHLSSNLGGVALSGVLSKVLFVGLKCKKPKSRQFEPANLWNMHFYQQYIKKLKPANIWKMHFHSQGCQ